MPVLFSELGHGGDPAEGHVLDPFGHLLYGAGADIAVDIGLGPELAQKLEELVGAEGIVFGDPAPVGVDHLLAFILGSDAIHPVVLVGKAAAGPAENGDVDGLQGFDDILSHAVDIGDVGVFADIDAFINAAAQVLGEVAVDFRLYVADFVFMINIKLCHLVSSFLPPHSLT